jgi:hypothetical protein
MELRVLTRRALLLPTPTEGSARGVFAFMRRQLQIIHLYRPGLWWGTALSVHGAVVSWVLLALLAAWGSGLALALLAAIAACGALRWRVMDMVGRRIGVRDPAPGSAAQLLIGLLLPVAELFLCALFWGSARTRFVRWRHVEYEVGRGGVVRAVRRFGYRTT